MARKTAQLPPEIPLYLAIPREEAARKIAERVQRGTELKTRRINTKQELKEVQQAYWTWSEYNEEMLRQMFTSPKIAEEYSTSAGLFFVGGRERYLEEEVREHYDSIDIKIRRLSSINERLELIQVAPGIRPAQHSKTSASGGKVFLVHGHDEGIREAVARFITRLDLSPVILHEQASQGRTIIEKLEFHGDVGYAVVLLTPDDVGGPSQQDLKRRARQNVVLELGYFVGRLGRDHVCAVHRGDIELPSDYMGVIYIPFDSGGGWCLLLAKELKAAGFSVDMNKVLL